MVKRSLCMLLIISFLLSMLSGLSFAQNAGVKGTELVTELSESPAQNTAMTAAADGEEPAYGSIDWDNADYQVMESDQYAQWVEDNGGNYLYTSENSIASASPEEDMEVTEDDYLLTGDDVVVDENGDLPTILEGGTEYDSDPKVYVSDEDGQQYVVDGGADVTAENVLEDVSKQKYGVSMLAQAETAAQTQSALPADTAYNALTAQSVASTGIAALSAAPAVQTAAAEEFDGEDESGKYKLYGAGGSAGDASPGEGQVYVIHEYEYLVHVMDPAFPKDRTKGLEGASVTLELTNKNSGTKKYTGKTDAKGIVIFGADSPSDSIKGDWEGWLTIEPGNNYQRFVDHSSYFSGGSSYAILPVNKISELYLLLANIKYCKEDKETQAATGDELIYGNETMTIASDYDSLFNFNFCMTTDQSDTTGYVGTLYYYKNGERQMSDGYSMVVSDTTVKGDPKISIVTDGNQICAAIFEDDANSATLRKRIHDAVADLAYTLKKHDAEEILCKKRNSYSVITDRFECDYYHYLEGNANGGDSYLGEYMTQFSWAELTKGALE